MKTENTIEDLTQEIQDLSYTISDLKNRIDSVAGELFALVKVLESKRAVNK